MQRFLLKISIISFLSINSLSFGMEIIHSVEESALQKLPEDLRRHIFVVAHPSIQNQLKKCSISWHAIGAKKAPNMYQLVNNPSFNPSQDDWRYIMMHAALDKDMKIQKIVVDRNAHMTFGHTFKIDYFGDGQDRQQLDWNAPALRACLAGDIDKLQQELKVIEDKKSEIINAQYASDKAKVIAYKENAKVNAITLCDCVVIAVYNNNPYFITELSPWIDRVFEDLGCIKNVYFDFLFLAMRNNKKHVFRALVEHDEFFISDGRVRSTILNSICNQEGVVNLDEYIAMYVNIHRESFQKIKPKKSSGCSLQ